MDSKSIQIRRIFLTRDADEIQHLQKDAPEFKRHYPKHNEWLKMAINEVISGKRFAFGVYTTRFNYQGEAIISLVGSMILKKEMYSHIMELKNLYIKPDERRKKYGRALFEVIEQFCVKRGCTRIETEVPYEELGTVNFLNSMGFFVQHYADSPYRKADRICRMYKHLPNKYTGDPFDLFNLSCWLFENFYNFRAISHQEPNIDFSIAGSKFDFESITSPKATQIQGSAYVLDRSDDVSVNDVKRFLKDKKKHILAIIARNFSEEAKRHCENNRILHLDKATIENELRNVFSVEIPQFQKEDIKGMIVPINSKYFVKLSKSFKDNPTSYFKGGPVGKYLKKGDLILFYIEQSTDFPSGGLRAYAEINSCEVGAPITIWQKHKEINPIFPEDEYFAWCVDKSEVVALTFSKVSAINPISHLQINQYVTTTPFDNERLGQFYLDRDNINNFLQYKQNYEGSIHTDTLVSKIQKLGEKGVVHMSGIHFHGEVKLNGNIVNIEGSQYNFQSDSKEKILNAIGGIVRAGLNGTDIASSINVLSKDIEMRKDISDGEIASAVHNAIASEIRTDEHKSRLKDIWTQLSTGTAGSLLASGIIEGIKMFL